MYEKPRNGAFLRFCILLPWLLAETITADYQMRLCFTAYPACGTQRTAFLHQAEAIRISCPRKPRNNKKVFRSTLRRNPPERQTDTGGFIRQKRAAAFPVKPAPGQCKSPAGIFPAGLCFFFPYRPFPHTACKKETPLGVSRVFKRSCVFSAELRQTLRRTRP